MGGLYDGPSCWLLVVPFASAVDRARTTPCRLSLSSGNSWVRISSRRTWRVYLLQGPGDAPEGGEAYVPPCQPLRGVPQRAAVLRGTDGAAAWRLVLLVRVNSDTRCSGHCRTRAQPNRASRSRGVSTFNVDGVPALQRFLHAAGRALCWSLPLSSWRSVCVTRIRCDGLHSMSGVGASCGCVQSAVKKLGFDDLLPFPGKKAFGRFEREFLAVRHRMLNAWLSSLITSPVGALRLQAA